MTQNVSTAVMARRVEPDDSLDDFPTQPWGTRALIEHVLFQEWSHEEIGQSLCWEPACNRGYMQRPLSEYFGAVIGSDIHDYGAAVRPLVVDGLLHDFLMPYMPDGMACRTPEWIISNPPFRLAAQFVLRALEVATQGVAMLVRTSFAEGADRYKNLFLPHPPLFEAIFVERLPMLKGRVERKASTATSYTWLVWPGRDFIQRRCRVTHRLWIPPCRKQLERPGDYA